MDLTHIRELIEEIEKTHREFHEIAFEVEKASSEEEKEDSSERQWKGGRVWGGQIWHDCMDGSISNWANVRTFVLVM